MRTEKKEIQKIEYVTTYIADDGTEFKSEEECKKYEQTATCAINGMFNKLKIQKFENVAEYEPFNNFYCEDTMYAVKIESVEQLEIVNKWIKDHGDNRFLGSETIGTFQLLNEFEGGIWPIGTPDKLKEEYCKGVDKFFDTLIEKAEESKGENA